MAPHRYAVRPGGKREFPSVTAISGMLDKPGLPWGAANETALFAIHHQDEWTHLDAPEAFERLRKHHRGVWNDKAARGTTVHDLAHAWARGETVECPPDCDPYLDALERFYDEQQPVWIECEREVAYDVTGLEYGGRFDAIAAIDGRNVQLDWKSGKRYPVDVILQMAGYRYATGLAVYDAFGKVLERIDPMPQIDASAVVYLHGDGTYEMLELPVDEHAFEMFLCLRRLKDWLRDAEAWEKQNPAPDPFTTREAATA